MLSYIAQKFRRTNPLSSKRKITQAEYKLCLKIFDLKNRDKTLVLICEKNVHCDLNKNLFWHELGKVYAWGLGKHNQLGVGFEDDMLKPIQVTSQNIKNRHVINVAAGGQHTLFLAGAKQRSKRVIRAV